MKVKSETSNSYSTSAEEEGMKHTIRVVFDGGSRDIELPMSETLAGLQRTVSSVLRIGDNCLASSQGKDSDPPYPLKFTYRDPNWGEFVLEKDSQLALALRTGSEPLEITATVPGASRGVHVGEQVITPARAGAGERLYRAATLTLRAQGVVSMKTSDLKKAMVLLKLCPRRLVVQGLASPRLLRGETPILACPLGPCGTNKEACSPQASASSETADEDDTGDWSDFAARIAQV